MAHTFITAINEINRLSAAPHVWRRFDYAKLSHEEIKLTKKSEQAGDLLYGAKAIADHLGIEETVARHRIAQGQFRLSEWRA